MILQFTEVIQDVDNVMSDFVPSEIVHPSGLLPPNDAAQRTGDMAASALCGYSPSDYPLCVSCLRLGP